MRIELYKHSEPPYHSWVAFIPQHKIIVEYYLKYGGIIFEGVDGPFYDAKPCSRLEFLVLFGVTLGDIEQRVRNYIQCR